ncbi:class I adenylate cyclase [Dasania sp. GY-MA-18]|uniref:Class I adenylate cyclase n=1 Tax=Dasania phycosphaerae TaxID=2950436 RepID=A0A9J6RJS2_9GAMM|nr:MULTISPECIES: class I adenylate cyclase [Dasania]MCR8922506.1 class I adenylate cyclase [Dasania sp. GY-MA-18]MCZ0864934.1 class I adenylate cyclase [Dasania phycosphaerae]MCZ0868662.1 class I adenylate cyclase [Dasania phycosphaerae]
MSTHKNASSDAAQPSIDYGIDRKQLKTVKERFLQVNAVRLERTQQALSDRQQVFLQLLPLLFHVNHPMLPGYVSHQTPFGVSHYTPSKEQQLAATKLARSFTYRFQPPVGQQIHGLFLMGSCGTVAQSDRSDIDIWVCHSSDVDQEGLLQLRQKCDKISAWAMSIGVEAHCFLMDSEKFKQGERANLSGEDCGSSQHFLLLDEFYRTGLLLAGRIPIWWLCPPEQESRYQDYVDTLIKKRFIPADDSLDFGNVGQIPAGEFVGAGIWQLYKGIDSPYKSTLKILLSEVYADQYPNIEPLSTGFKRAIYNKQLDVNELDPYVMVFRKLEQYLIGRNELARLELIRRCFYFKVGKALSRPQTHNVKSWQRQLLEKLTSEWQWPREHIHSLDAKDKWKVARVIAEQKDIVRELTNSYRFLLDFARRTQATALINSADMTLLGRKLYAAFERKAGKVEWINPGISNSLAEDRLNFYYVDSPASGNSYWGVSTEPLLAKDTEQHDPLKRGDHLIGLLVWCHFNGLLSSHTRCNIVNGAHDVGEFELLNLIRALQKTLPIASQYTDHGDQADTQFSRPMRPTLLQLFINISTDPLSSMRNQGIERLSDQTDSLSYSGMRENLVLNIEQVLVNSWGELITRRYDGESALLRCLRDYLQMIPPGSNKALPTLEIHCFCASRAAAISHRVEELFSDIAACYHGGNKPANSRYVLKVQHDYYILQFNEQQPTIENMGEYSDMLDYLAGNISGKQTQFSPLVFDRHCQSNNPVAALSPYMQAGNIQVFYLCQQHKADIYIIDELGVLNHFSAPCLDKNNFLTPLDLFLQSTLFRQNNETIDTQGDLNTLPQDNIKNVDYYEIINKKSGYTIIRNNPINHEGCPSFFNVQAIGSRDNNGLLLFTIYCDQKEFSEQEYGEQLYNAVAQHILQRRQSKERYPCYITDLDLSLSNEKSGDSTPTNRYLFYKKRLEQALNAALLQV